MKVIPYRPHRHCRHIAIIRSHDSAGQSVQEFPVHDPFTVHCSTVRSVHCIPARKMYQ